MSVRIFCFLLVIGLAVLVFQLKKNRIFLKGLLSSILMGSCTFFAVKLLGLFIPVSLPLNAFTAGVSLFGGIPGVIFLLLGQCICRL